MTVSIAELMIGILRRSSLVSWADVSASRGRVSEYRGTRRTSSNVNPSETIFGVCMGKHTEVDFSGDIRGHWHGHCSAMYMQYLWKFSCLAVSLFFLACSQSTQPTDSNLRFADVLDIKVSASSGQITCLMYVQAYNGCQEPRIVDVQQNASQLDIAVSTFQTSTGGCDTAQSVKKVWHTFANIPDSSAVTIRIRADRDTRTNMPVDTTIIYSLK